MYCAISGQVPEDPVVSSRSGHLFERQLIEKYIAAEGKCPATGEELGKDDLLPIKAERAVKPRPLTATSVPGLLALFQNEWDDLMLETHSLKRTLDQTRLQLSEALYQHDAATRVIARLIHERDEARAQLAQAAVSSSAPMPAPSQPSLAGPAGPAAAGAAAAATTSDGDAAMSSAAAEQDGGGNGGGLGAAVDAQLAAVTAQLQEGRRNRVKPTGVPSAEAVAQWEERASHTLHKSNKPGVLCVDVDPCNAARVLSGGTDCTVQIFDTKVGQVVGTLLGHSKKVTQARFPLRRTQGQADDVIFTASADKTARVWAPEDGAKGGYSVVHRFDCHSKDVTAVIPHPAQQFVVTASLDKSWALHDVAAGRTVLHVQDPPIGNDARLTKGFSCAAVHPDGGIMSTGGADNIVRAWDVRSQDHVCAFDTHNGQINALAFSENGYHLASGSADGFVRLWDLRKLKMSKELDMSEGGAVHSVIFDASATYLAAGGDKQVRVVTAKKFAHVTSIAAHTKPVRGVCFSSDTSCLASVGMDRALKIFN